MAKLCLNAAHFAVANSIGQVMALMPNPTLYCIQANLHSFQVALHRVLHLSIAFIPAMHSSRCIHVECIPRGNIKSNAALRGSEETGDVGETSSNHPPSPDLVRSDHFNLCNSSNFFFNAFPIRSHLEAGPNGAL